MTPTPATLPQTIILLSLSRGEQPPIIPPVTRRELLRKRWIAHAGTRPVSNGGERPTFEITEAGTTGARDVEAHHRGAEADRLRGKEQTMARVDLDELERRARATIAARRNAPKSIEGQPLVTVEVACAAWDYRSATDPPVTFALIARIRELEAFVAAIPESGLQADKLYREDFPGLFSETGDTCKAMYMDVARDKLLEKGVVLE